jgi:hypothetical protein
LLDDHSGAHQSFQGSLDVGTRISGHLGDSLRSIRSSTTARSSTRVREQRSSRASSLRTQRASPSVRQAAPVLADLRHARPWQLNLSTSLQQKQVE